MAIWDTPARSAAKKVPCHGAIAVLKAVVTTVRMVSQSLGLSKNMLFSNGFFTLQGRFGLLDSVFSVILFISKNKMTKGGHTSW